MTTPEEPRMIEIGKKRIGEGEPVFIIAEAGVNHNGSLEAARALVREAHASGADCVKFQTFKAERVATAGAPKAKYQLGTTDKNESQLDMLKKLELKYEDHVELKSYAESLGIVFMSTPYSFEDIDLLESIGVPAYKVASGQIIELLFLQRIARTGKPVVLSTGMATLAEADEAVRAIRAEGNGKIVLLQCTTDYPSRLSDCNLRAMATLRSSFGLPVGYSDHTTGDEAAIATVALGARVIEKHFTLDKSLPGPDHSSSFTPSEFSSLVKKIRAVEVALGSGRKEPSATEKENAKGMRRSLVAGLDIRKGEVIKEGMITFKRPAAGLSPSFYGMVVGKSAARDIAKDELFTMEMVEW